MSGAVRAAATANIDTAAAPVDFELLRAVEQFLIREADYMDDHDYDAWLALDRKSVV